MNKFNLPLEGTPTEFGNLNELERFRFENGQPFPTSYKDFVHKYGYGLTAGQFIIYIPMDDYGDSWNLRSNFIKSTYYNDVINNDIWFDLKPDATIEILKCLVPFSMSENGYYLFWDIESFTNNECDIYITDFRGTGFRRIGRTLYEVIDKLTSPMPIPPFTKGALPAIFRCLRKII